MSLPKCGQCGKQAQPGDEWQVLVTDDEIEVMGQPTRTGRTHRFFCTDDHLALWLAEHRETLDEGPPP